MSTSIQPPASPSAGPRWFWFLLVGVTLILLGAMALGATALLDFTSVLLLGPLLLANSGCQLVLASFTGTQRGRWLHLSSAVFSLIVGFLVMSHGAEAGADLALLLTAFLMVAGFNRIFGSLQADLPARGWIMAAGALALALGICVWAQAPTRGLFLISICVALDFLFHGVSWVWFSMVVRGTLDSPIPASEEIRAPSTNPPPLQKH